MLDKNYGQHTAIKAGLDNCSGTWVVVMDCDLQDQPEAIIELMKKQRKDLMLYLLHGLNEMTRKLNNGIPLRFMRYYHFYQV